MKHKKRIILFIYVLLCLLSCTACAKRIGTEQKELDVRVTDITYEPESSDLRYIGNIYAGNNMSIPQYMPVTIPEKYIVTVSYDDETYSVDDKDLYEKYKDKIGETTIAVFDIDICDDGDVVKRFVRLK